jgi:hypothetical protein
MLVSFVHPVANRRADFWIVSSWPMFVLEAIGPHIVQAYSTCGLVIAF